MIPEAAAERTPAAPAPSEAGPQKSKDAFRTISEVSEELDIPAHVLRFWETKFAQLSPLKRGGRRRYYRPSDLDLLRGIRRLLYDDGLTIKGLQKLFRERGVRYVAGLGRGEVPAAEPMTDAPVAEPFAAESPTPGLVAVIARLEALRDRLRAA